MIKRTAPTVIALAIFGSTAAAEGWSVVNFSSMGEQSDCMARAEATIAQYRQTYDTQGPTRSTEWTVAGFNLRGDVIDAIFMCPMEAGLAAPFLIVYNTDDDSAAREVISDRLQDIWREVDFSGPTSGNQTDTGSGADEAADDGVVNFN